METFGVINAAELVKKQTLHYHILCPLPWGVGCGRGQSEELRREQRDAFPLNKCKEQMV